MRGDFGAVGVRDVGGENHFTAPDHGDLVGQRGDLADLVADEENGGAAVTDMAQKIEEFVDLLRGQNRGWFVEDQNAGAAP